MMFTYSNKGKRGHLSVHRAVAREFCEGYFPNAVVNHIDGNSLNNDYTNLEWCDQSHNIRESYKNSGLDQTRNYKVWILYSPDNEEIARFKGGNLLNKYLEENNLSLSASMLQKHKEHKGYYIRVIDKKEYQDTQELIERI